MTEQTGSPEPRADDDPSERVTAYCAPGLKGYATRLLEANGERFREVIEHPYMTGHTDVVLTTDPEWGSRQREDR